MRSMQSLKRFRDMADYYDVGLECTGRVGYKSEFSGLCARQLSYKLLSCCGMSQKYLNPTQFAKATNRHPQEILRLIQNNEIKVKIKTVTRYEIPAGLIPIWKKLTK